MKRCIQTIILSGGALMCFFPVSCEQHEPLRRPENRPPGQILDSSAFVRMKIDADYKDNVKDLILENDSSYTIILPAGDPYLMLLPLDEALPAENTVFAFEYKAENPIDKTEFFFVDAESGLNASNAQSGPGAGATDEWKHYSVRMKSSIRDFDWGRPGDCLRFDIGESVVEGSAICIRNIFMRPMNAAEQAEEDAENSAAEEKEKYAQRIADYLSADYASAVTSVAVGAAEVSVSGTCSGEGEFFLAEIPPFADIFSMTDVPEEYRHEISSSQFVKTLARETEYHGVRYDRLLSKWAIFRESEEGDELVSHARYADPDKIYDVGPGLARIELTSKKGLGGIVPDDRLGHEIRDLGLKSATINLLPMSYMSLTQGGAYTIGHEYCGRTYYFDEKRIAAELDAPLRTAAEYGMSVAAILLIQNAAQSADKELGDLLQHPDYSGTLYTMPDMTTPESVHAYAAMIDFFAERYSCEDMRVSHWIIHNEVDGGIHWTNMGPDVPAATYMDTYLKSMRMVYNIVHQYDANAQAFISLTHGWKEPAGGGWYPVVDILGFMNGFSDAEGDFYWAPAYHSYSSEMANPRIWEDPNVTFSMDTPNVSMKNLEVLDRWVKTEENMYKGTQMRKVWLSEAGVGSGSGIDYGDASLLSDQAAGCAYSWLKIEALEGIEGLQWHNWYDNASEGAQLGLRKYDDAIYGGEPKPVWYAYKAAGTESQDSYFGQEGYAGIVGEEWGKIHPIETTFHLE